MSSAQIRHRERIRSQWVAEKLAKVSDDFTPADRDKIEVELNAVKFSASAGAYMYCPNVPSRQPPFRKLNRLLDSNQEVPAWLAESVRLLYRDSEFGIKLVEKLVDFGYDEANITNPALSYEQRRPNTSMPEFIEGHDETETYDGFMSDDPGYSPTDSDADDEASEERETIPQAESDTDSDDDESSSDDEIPAPGLRRSPRKNHPPVDYELKFPRFSSAESSSDSVKEESGSENISSPSRSIKSEEGTPAASPTLGAMATPYGAALRTSTSVSRRQNQMAMGWSSSESDDTDPELDYDDDDVKMEEEERLLPAPAVQTATGSGSPGPMCSPSPPRPSERSASPEAEAEAAAGPAASSSSSPPRSSLRRTGKSAKKVVAKYVKSTKAKAKSKVAKMVKKLYVKKVKWMRKSRAHKLKTRKTLKKIAKMTRSSRDKENDEMTNDVSRRAGSYGERPTSSNRPFGLFSSLRKAKRAPAVASGSESGSGLSARRDEGEDSGSPANLPAEDQAGRSVSPSPTVANPPGAVKRKRGRPVGSGLLRDKKSLTPTRLSKRIRLRSASPIIFGGTDDNTPIMQARTDAPGVDTPDLDVAGGKKRKRGRPVGSTEASILARRNTEADLIKKERASSAEGSPSKRPRAN